MKKILHRLLAFTFLVFTFSFIKAQPKDPVVWSYTAKKKADKTYDIIITASLPSPGISTAKIPATADLYLHLLALILIRLL